MFEVIYRYRRSGQIQDLKIATLERAMSLAALNFRESIEPIYIKTNDKIYDTNDMRNYIKVHNIQ
ncbi:MULTISPECIES: hypothetical protein [Paenibacillus]|uniref:hypothetical protein n=1 Tax=Paenibacillus TaxID=44249 RepID=UPI001C1FE0E7|nr:hypothetical protein [Paenibacillus oleatilyticus]MBU7316052.1 hypothetical protein [Paenibacillus oleatilyticus]GMX64503.1 hypothetical protein Elgi_37720 [Paenibacillus elgii]